MVDQKQPSTYTEANIDYLEGVEHVRKRPGMYMGGTDIKALHHMVYEVVDNSVDEALAGRCDTIEVILHADNAVTVNDNGAGIPVAVHPKFGVSALELVMTKIGAGGKFDNNAYKVSGGLHGVGVSAVNALSEHVTVQVRRDGHLFQQTYARGHAVTPVEKVRPLEPGEPSGTRTTFLPDPTIMEETEFSYHTLLQRFREMAFLASGVTLILRDERTQPFPREMTFYFEGGVRSFVYYLNRNRDALHPIVYGSRDVVINGDNSEKSYTIGVEFAFQYTDSSTTTELAFANTINTPDGGQHQSGMRTAITRTINNYARKAGLLKEKEPNFSGNDTLEGLTAIVSIKHPDPQFESQTKVKLMNAEVNGAVSQVVGDIFAEFLETNSREARRIVEKCMTSMRARDAAKKASELVRRGSNLLENTTLPGKLADCSSRDPNGTELYIVEGDSAGGCFSGDTRIALADGRELSFEEIISEQAQGKVHFCYTLRPDKTIGIEQIINPRMTRRNAEVIRITLDNGETITCTPDHLFMLRDGSYKQAQDLMPTDSLMPLYRKLSSKEKPGTTIDGYEMVWCPRSDSWLFTHLLADWYNRWKGVYDEVTGDHCHHIDFNKYNNNPTNIVRMPAEEHLALHREHIQHTLHRSDKWREFYTSNEEYREQNRKNLYHAQFEYWNNETDRKMQAAAQKAAKQWQDEGLLEWRRGKTREQWTDEFRTRRKAALQRTYYDKTIAALKQFEAQGELDLEAYNTYRLEKKDKSLLKFDTFCQRYFDGKETVALDAISNYNHRITAIERVEETLDVYDIEVPNTHNFALASGVFVHNSAKQGRDRHFQAILPLRGKILNTERARLHKILDNNEVRALISALGVGIHPDFDITKLRYQSIIIMTDADVDGAHIRTLLLTFFFRYMQPLITEGHLFIAQPPIYRLAQGKDARYYYAQPGENDAATLARALKDFKNPEKAHVQRYKGLGEMNPDQLWETTMNPENRLLLQVTIEDASEADKTFDMLMGNAVPPRKRFIQTHARTVRNLDI